QVDDHVAHGLIALRRVVLETLQTIIHASPRPLGDEVPLPLRMIVEKALENDPSERYQTMRDMVVDLRRVARRQLPDATEASAAARASRRRTWPWVAAVALVTSAIGVAAGRWFFASAAVPIASTVQLQRMTD